ncbi:Uncharacterised protein [Mycobacterium tuberculosis]|uniref:Uncharacterized protein n=1 Tax=Mycobacterium tuberculosis TaxID=1773 RepID=A0A916L7A4_MYCTX|nr:Uncharacterised protein [Mycobacterium tuberculosis]COW99290.1 Uncharacterised protein [Mycobacterium tuberculosis]COY26312.1 Uncharacterised protein [Mycobacterium tuberculosis]
MVWLWKKRFQGFIRLSDGYGTPARIAGWMFMICCSRLVNSALTFGSVTPKTTRRMMSRVSAFMWSRLLIVAWGRQRVMCSRATEAIMSRYPRSAARVNAGMSSDRIRACSASSVINTECSPMTKPRMWLPSPACSDLGSAAKISLMCSGRV